MKRKLEIISVITVLVLVVGFWQKDRLYQQFFKPTSTTLDQGVSLDEDNDTETEVIAQNLNIPWGLAFLPDGDILLTERTGALTRVSDGEKFNISDVAHQGESGLLGLVLHPDFENNNLLYLYLTTQTDNGLINRVEQYTFDGESLSSRETIINNIPGATYHDGGRIAFGPDGMLYIATGDAGNPDLAQDTSSLAGKILRLNADGSIPEDNPYANPVYSYGHRNPQGLAWDSQGRLWSSEHGPSGLQSGFDELNLIQSGGNYGWPIIKGDESRSDMISPVAQSGADETWAPASLTYGDGSLFFGGLRGESLYEAKIINDDEVNIISHFRSDYGRIRTAQVFEGNVYITTSNTDGRGQLMQDDDKLIKLSLDIFNTQN